jgi:aspartate aminotransferase-like enzyme
MKKYLLTPGPTPVPERVLLTSAQPIIHHRTYEYGRALSEDIEGLKYVFQTKNDILIFTASGTGAMEACVANLLSPQDKVLVVNTGAFGRRWVDIINSFGIKADVIEYSWGKAARPEDVEKKLKQTPGIKAVFTQSTETSTGVVNDIEAIGKIVARTEAILVVDAVSGLGGQELKTDEWNVDVVASGSQKGLMLPPGLAFVSISQKAWKLVENSKLPKFYWNFKAYKKSLQEGETPYTSAVSLVLALQESLKMIKEEGLEKILKRHAILASATRRGVKAIGLQLFAEVPCNVVTAIKVPEGIDGSRLVRMMLEEYGVGIADGQREYKGKIFRIAHLGYMDRFDVIIGLSALEIALSRLGYKLEIGKGVAEAEKEFLKHS